MTPQSIAEAVRRIDELQQQLTLARTVEAELIGMVDVLRAERDSWRAAAQ